MTQPTSAASPVPESSSSAEADLLASLVNPQPPYPWSPFSPEAEAYLAEAEAELADASLDGAIAAGWQRFSADLESQWAQVAGRPNPVAESLLNRFQGSIPSQVLQSIATTALAMVDSGQSLLDQLVACAQAVLPTWEQDDLAVLARPLAYALRDGQSEILDLSLSAIPQTDWNQISEVDRARLSLAIATVALQVAQTDAA
ncbi:MAG TPA: hypothetical protein IGR64_06615 [Leptolyngbyaceae cyanobacterium M65_K2018_010]|nr:hypothetical protein [Leptolyngbyaceae cyanobacterium M65_K2018_010]